MERLQREYELDRLLSDNEHLSDYDRTLVREKPERGVIYFMHRFENTQKVKVELVQFIEEDEQGDYRFQVGNIDSKHFLTFDKDCFPYSRVEVKPGKIVETLISKT